MTREKAIEILKEIIDEGWLISDFEKCVAIDACEMATQALEKEPFMNKPCVSVGVCEHDKLQLLDRIKADIEKQQYGFMNSTDYANGVRFGLMLAYKIIKKYKKESEG